VGLVGVCHIKLWVEVCHDLESGLFVACLPFTLSGSAAVTSLEVEEEMESHLVVGVVVEERDCCFPSIYLV